MRAILLFLAVTLVSAGATADEARDRETALYLTGRRHYNMGELAAAAASWKEGYAMSGKPYFLFNMAQAYRQQRDYAKAAFFYRSYLRETSPEDPKREEVTHRLTELERAIAEGDRPPNEALPPDRAPTSAPVPPPAPSPPARPGRGMRWGGVATGAVGLAAATVGTVLLVKGHRAAGALEEAGGQDLPWSEARADELDGARRDAGLGAVLLGVGAAAVAGGVVLYVLGARSDERAALAVIPVVHTSGAGLAARVSF